MSIVSITSAFATAKYDYAIVLPKDDEEAFSIIYLSFIIAILFTIFLFLFTIIFKENILYLLNNGDLNGMVFVFYSNFYFCDCIFRYL